jgi:CRP-like cAMP-binding protein
MARKSKYNKQIAQIIVDAIAEGANKKDAAIAAGICEDTLYEWLNTKPEFSELLAKTESDKVKQAESKLWEQVQKGNIKAIMFYLQCKRPENYRPSSKTEVTGTLQIEMLADAISKAWEEQDGS